MQHHQTGENVDTMEGIDISAVQSLIQPDHSEIKQIRRFLLILVCICLVSFCFEENSFNRKNQFSVFFPTNIDYIYIL